MKTIIERGASWTLDETKLLLALWGQDLVERQVTGTKRTKETYERISEKFLAIGYERTPEQVRTRVFNMIAEYRRILKDENPERMKKCIFFEALHKLYQAKHLDDVKSALDDYEPDCPFDPHVTKFLFDESDDSESVKDNDAAATTSNSHNSNNSSSNNNRDDNDNNNRDTSSSTNSNNNNNNNNNNNSDKESSPSSDANNQTNSMNQNEASQPNASSNNGEGPSSSKKPKLEKASSTPVSTNSITVASATPISSSTPIETFSTAGPSTSAAGAATSAASATNSTSNISESKTKTSTITANSASSSNQRHQSLLLPTSSSAGASTPLNNKSNPTGTNNIYMNINSAKLPIIRTNQLIGNGNDGTSTPGTTRLPTTAAIASHQLYQAPVNTFDVTSSALLIDRMFAHLSRESENMREWIALEKERLALERIRRQQETERDNRRERVLTETLMKFQEQWLNYISRLDPVTIERNRDSQPELKLPPRDSSQATTSTSNNNVSTDSSSLSQTEESKN